MWCHYLNRHVLSLKNMSVMSLSKHMFYHWKMCDVIIWIDMFYHWKMWVWCHYLNRHVLWLKNVSVMSLSKQTCIILKSLWLLIISYHALFCCCHLLFWMLSYQQIHPFTWLVEGKWFFFLFFILFFCIVCPTLTVWRLTLTVHSGLVFS